MIEDFDFDALNEMQAMEVPTLEEKSILIGLVYTSTLTDQEREETLEEINLCIDYQKYQKLQYQLEILQVPIDQMTNPGQKDISAHLSRAIPKPVPTSETIKLKKL